MARMNTYHEFGLTDTGGNAVARQGDSYIEPSLLSIPPTPRMQGDGEQYRDVYARDNSNVHLGDRYYFGTRGTSGIAMSDNARVHSGDIYNLFYSEQPFSDYANLVKILGSGTFGTVMAVKRLNDNRVCISMATLHLFTADIFMTVVGLQNDTV